MAAQESLMDRMIIDCEKVVNVIVDFIRKRVEEEKKDGVVLGLSGGLDSTTVAILTTKAVGPEKVHALYLPDRDSQERFGVYSQKVAEKLGINFEVKNISKSVKEQGVYKPPIMGITRFLPFLNKLIVFTSNKIIYPLFFREIPFAVTLKKGASAKNILAKIVYNSIAAA
ncbi:unnamed protein product, partial [marine sediment metagenome]